MRNAPSYCPQPTGAWLLGLKFLTEDKPPFGLLHDLGGLSYAVHLQPVRPCTRQCPLLSLILRGDGLQGERNVTSDGSVRHQPARAVLEAPL